MAACDRNECGEEAEFEIIFDNYRDGRRPKRRGDVTMPVTKACLPHGSWWVAGPKGRIGRLERIGK